MSKKYDYYLLVFISEKGEEIHMLAPFQTGIAPESYCDELMRQSRYSSYTIYPLTVGPKR